jgi:hypothetical protein
MQVITTIGLDIAKSVFQVHGIDPAARRKRSPPKICADIFPLARALISRNGTYGMSAPGERPTPP